MPRRPDADPWPFVGIGGLAALAFIYGASVLVLPGWLVACLCLFWVVLFLRALRTFTPRPRETALLPLIGFVVWIGCVAAVALAQ